MWGGVAVVHPYTQLQGKDAGDDQPGLRQDSNFLLPQEWNIQCGCPLLSSKGTYWKEDVDVPELTVG